jgi:hypothetical protein
MEDESPRGRFAFYVVDSLKPDMCATCSRVLICEGEFPQRTLLMTRCVFCGGFCVVMFEYDISCLPPPGRRWGMIAHPPDWPPRAAQCFRYCGDIQCSAEALFEFPPCWGMTVDAPLVACEICWARVSRSIPLYKIGDPVRSWGVKYACFIGRGDHWVVISDLPKPWGGCEQS